MANNPTPKALEILDYFNAEQMVSESTPFELSFYSEAIKEIKQLSKKENKTMSSKNNGGKTNYYKIKKRWKTAQDIIEARKMNFAQGNIFKVAITFNIGRHDASSYERELNKIDYFVKREKKRLKKEKQNDPQAIHTKI